MTRFKLALAALLVSATPLLAAPSPQLVAQVQSRLPFYGINVDVSQFDTRTVAELFFALNQRKGYLDTRRRLRAILRNPGYL